MTDAEILRAAAEILQRAAPRGPTHVAVRVLTQHAAEIDVPVEPEPAERPHILVDPVSGEQRIYEGDDQAQ